MTSHFPRQCGNSFISELSIFESRKVAVLGDMLCFAYWCAYWCTSICKEWP